MTSALLLLTMLSAPKWELTFDQTFDGPKGQLPDASIWRRDVGGSGYGNNELESYTAPNAKNAFLDGEGHLIIEARKEPTKGPDGIARDYSSARMVTKGTFEQRYGKMEARMKLPKGKGIWPAFWMLGADIDKVGWPRCGEVDILENIGRMPTTVYGTLHGPGYSGGSGIQGSTTCPDLSEAFHNYGVEWTPEKIVWTFDGKPFHTVEASDVGNKEWPFEKPQFIILNLAVGGAWPGNPDETTVFPQRLVVDSVKVWKDANLVVDDAALAKRHAERMAKVVTYREKGPTKLPGTVALVDYLPGEGVGYHDSDGVNEGGAYRTDGVDIGASGVAGMPYSIGWTKPGEWLTYDVDSPEPTNYTVTLTAASEPEGGAIELSMDGSVFSTVKVPSTGGWTNWRPLSAGTVGLLAGKHRLKVRMKAGGPTGAVGNVLSVKFEKV